MTRVNSNSVTFSVTPSVNDTAPLWFRNLPDKTWTAIAGGVGYSGQAYQKGNTQYEVRQELDGKYYGGIEGLNGTYQGMCALQETNEVFFVAQGGHSGRGANDVYALGLYEETPTWRRIKDSSDPSVFPDGGLSDWTYNGTGTYQDGSPRAGHGFLKSISAAGRLWMPGITGMYIGMSGAPNSGYTSALYSVARGARGSAISSSGSNGGWTYHGKGMVSPPGGWAWELSPTAYDPVTRKFYCWQKSGYPGGFWVSVDPPYSSGSYDYSALGSERYWGCVITNAAMSRSWFVTLNVPYVNDERLCIFDLQNPSAGWKDRRPGDGYLVYDTGATILDQNFSCTRAFHHLPSNSIVTWGPGMGSSIRRFIIPADPMNGVWHVSALVPAAGGSPVPGQNVMTGNYGSLWGRLEMINDMGSDSIRGNRSALVVSGPVGSVNGTVQPTYVYALPASGL